MNEKLTLQDLVDLLAKKAGLTKKEADAFFREFLSLITENIFNNEPVKIKDFGTFKLTLVNKRESVNVNTGEKIEIPAHYKLSFLPDKSLKTIVNKPFEHFETELLSEDVTFDSIEVSEEPVEASEIEDTGIDEPDLTTTTIIEEPIIQAQQENINIESRIEEIQGSEPKTNEEEDTANISGENRIKTPSFVYTYTSDKLSSNSDDVITINVPSQQLIDEMTKAIENIKPTITPQQLEVKEIQKDEESDDIEVDTNIPLDVNKVQEKIDQLKDAIDSLMNISWYNEDKDKSSRNESPYEEVKTSNIYTPQEIDENHNTEEYLENESHYSNNNLNEENRESQDQELIDDLIERSTEFSNINKTSLDSEEETNPSDPIITDDLEEDDLDYYNYNKDGFWQKAKRRAPIIIFLLIVIIAGFYLFSKLFEQKQIYDRYSVYPGLSEADTLPKAALNPETPNYHIFDRDPFNSTEIDNINGNQNNIQDNDSIEDSFQDQKISDNLSIAIVNKANYFLNNKNNSPVSSQEPLSKKNKEEYTEQKIVAPNKQFPTKEEVIAGSSLRSIARRHYGDNAFWVYIYEENKDKIKGYDNLNIGQVLIIPDLKKYNTSTDSTDAIEKAKSLERKILSGTK